MFARLHETLNDFARAIIGAVEAQPAIADYALTAANEGVLMHRLVLRAACLQEDDFASPRAVIEVDAGDKLLNRVFNGEWAHLLQPAKDVTVLTIPVKPTDERSTIGEDQASLGKRLLLAGSERLGYRALLALWRFVPPGFARAEALISGENELVKETAVHLGFRGIALRMLTARAAEDLLLAAHIRDNLRNALEPVITEATAPVSRSAGRGPRYRHFF